MVKKCSSGANRWDVIATPRPPVGEQPFAYASSSSASASPAPRYWWPPRRSFQTCSPAADMQPEARDSHHSISRPVNGRRSRAAGGTVSGTGVTPRPWARRGIRAATSRRRRGCSAGTGVYVNRGLSVGCGETPGRQHENGSTRNAAGSARSMLCRVVGVRSSRGS
jgi:hypothetical protein